MTLGFTWIDSGIKYECDICSEFFASKASLYTHKKSHSEVDLLFIYHYDC